MTKLSYAEQLRHPFWQRKRLQVLERDGWSCTTCGARETTLHVHHKRYIKGRQVWEYELDDLVSFCENCHASDHSARELLDEMLSRSTTLQTPAWIAGVVGGLLYGSYSIDGSIADRARMVDWRAFDVGLLACAAGALDARNLALVARDIYRLAYGYGAPIDPVMLSEIERWEAKATSP